MKSQKTKCSDKIKIYLDACILVSYFSNAKEEQKKKKIINTCLKYVETLENVDLVTSYWAVSEMINILISRHKMKTPMVNRIEESFSHTERLGKIKVRIIETSPLRDYSVKEFFYQVRTMILNYHPGVGDAMHSVILENNNIDKILTFDMKDDFTCIPGLTVIKPKEFIKGFKLAHQK